MNLHTSISGLGSRLQGLTALVRTKVAGETGSLVQQGIERLRTGLAWLLGAARSKAPLLHDGLMELLGWIRQARHWLRGIDYGARSVQAVGAAVVLGTLYVAIWGAGPRPVADSPEIVAARIAPIGTLSLQDTGSPVVAEQAPAAAASASSM
jgi:hypothetical protein